MRFFTRLFIAFLAAGTLAHADQDVDLTAHIINTSCKISFANNGAIDLGSVDINYFTNNTTVDDLHNSGTPFYITVDDCSRTGINNATRLVIQFRPKSGSFSSISRQIFANESTLGAGNVGVIILSLQSPGNIQNVLNPDGTPRSIYTFDPLNFSGKSYQFITRMQKIIPAQQVTSGVVRTSVMVNVYYE